MKKQSYERVIEKDIIEVKQYLLALIDEYTIQDIHDLVNRSIDVDDLKRRLSKRKELELVVFSEIKRMIDCASCFNEIEYHLVMMNLLIDKHYEPMLVYKYKFLNYIVEKAGFNIETYCLLRHLIKYTDKNVNNFIDALAKRLGFTNEHYHYLASHILLLEKQYKKVYNHLGYVTIDEQLEYYLPALYNFSPRLYHKYAKMMYVPLSLEMI